MHNSKRGPKFKYGAKTTTMRVPIDRVDEVKALLATKKPEQRNKDSDIKRTRDTDECPF